MDKLRKAMSAGDYTTKVPQEVRDANAERLEQMESEFQRLSLAKETLKNMQ